ncbi:transcriptional regulator, TetR family [Sphingobium faniae]|nr:transcriptional regulator, TetR family [Sphingobium faniae]
MSKLKGELDKWHGRGDASKARILEVARRLFVRQGFAATPVSQIAREAGLTIPPVYYHFGNKLGLFKAVIEAAGDQIDRDMDGLAPQPLRKGVAALVDRAVANIDAHVAGLRCRLLVSFQQNSEAEILLKMMQDQRERSIEQVSAFCRAMLDKDDPWLAQRSRLIAELYIAGIQNLSLDQMSGAAIPPLLAVKMELLVDSLARVGEVENFGEFIDAASR